MFRTLALLLVIGAVSVAAGLERRLYVTDKSGISVYDIDNGHKLVRKIELPGTGDYKGIAASPQLGKLYVTSYKGDELICIDLSNDAVVWKKKYGKYADSMMITPDGKTMYLPFRDEDSWWVLNAEDGVVKTKILVGYGKNYATETIGSPGPHNTWINPAGTRVYMEVLTLPWIFIADTATNKVIGKIGPFSKGLRPFTITDDEKVAYANVDGLLGFEVGAVRNGEEWGGPKILTVTAQTPRKRLEELPNPPAHKPHSTPSHGINIRPDQKEVWIVDGVYGYVYVYDVTKKSPKQIASIPLYQDPKEQPHPGWLTFGLDGRYAYPDGGAVIDTKTKKVAARIPTSEKLIEVDFEGGKPIKAGHR